MTELTQQQDTEQTRTGTAIVTCMAIFALLTGVLGYLDMLPEPVQAVAEQVEEIVQDEPEKHEETEVIPSDPTPRRIVIDAIDIDSVILNPTSTDIEILDEALLSGVVRYPESGQLDDETNLLLFGHSSYLPVIHNQNFKVFNELKNLEGGEHIKIQSETHEHLYKVQMVRLADANEAVIPLNTEKKMLTLVTCNSFGAKSERWVVTAEYIGSYPIEEK